MAQKLQPQQKFHYKRVELFKTESLGVGSYGAVYKAMCDDLPCAAKILHPALFEFTTTGSSSVTQKFEQECRLLCAIKHPHIVQYLGTYHHPETKLPVLLMELMDESLTQFLKRSQEPLPYHTEVNLCHDIALALSHLHSNGIIHRDLSSNNVLLIAGSSAKVTDFGMVKLCDVNRSTAHLTPCPGTTVYMSPEALRDRPVYTDKLDTFSLGVLCIQIMTRQFPDPGDRFKCRKISNPRISSGTVQVEVPEIERRRSHIDLIDLAHPLLPIAVDCLKNKDKERPSCHKFCVHMLTLKASPKYTESVQHSQVNTKPTQSASRESREKERQQSQQIRDLQHQLHKLSDQLHEKEQENQRQRQQIVGNSNLLTATIDQVQQKEAAVTTCQRTIQQLRQQLQSSEQVTAEFQQNLLEKEKMIQDQERHIQELQQQLGQRGDQRQEKMEASDAAASGCSIKLRWRDGGRAPSEMVGGVTAVDGSVVYFQPVGYGARKVFAYNSTIHKWSELPMCPNNMYGFSIAVVNGFLTAIGGKTPDGQVTNSLLSLTNSRWKERFLPMPTKRWLATTVSSRSSLVVAGGIGERDNNLRTVEVMDTETLQWSTASSFPHPLCSATATLCGDKLYMLGGWVQSGRSKSVFTCSLATLLQSCQPQSLGGLKTLSLARRPKVWHQLAGTPYTLSRCVSLQGQLLSVGGQDSDIKREATAVSMYNTTTDSWEVISHMATPRSRCLVAVLPYNELMVVGGYKPDGVTNSIEFATIV